MELAPVEESFRVEGFEAVSVGIVNWPMSVLRLNSDDKAQLIALADHILTAWRGYSDPAVQVLAASDGQPHHTITPIARIRDGHYELDLVLRDNQTSPEHPDGIYHPHADVQHIKKENIGLIEVMGLAICHLVSRKSSSRFKPICLDVRILWRPTTRLGRMT